MKSRKIKSKGKKGKNGQSQRTPGTTNLYDKLGHFVVQGGTGEIIFHTLFEGLFSWNAFDLWLQCVPILNGIVVTDF